MDETTESLAPVDFERALRELQEIVDRLERGDGALSQALEQYERGVKLLGRCQKVLEEAERSVALLTGVDAAGEPATAEFDATATADRDAPASAATPAKSGRTRKPKTPPPAGDGLDFVPF